MHSAVVKNYTCSFFIELAPEVNSIKKLQVYFTCGTFFSTSSHKFKFNESFCKFPPLQASNCYLQWYFIEFFSFLHELHTRTSIAKKYTCSFYLQINTSKNLVFSNVGVWITIRRSLKCTSPYTGIVSLGAAECVLTSPKRLLPV